ncbi:MAG: 4-(cytidine 5'-diphospho)-2-C-methyl-D-erythritol kinase [Betaproteobacteria bacterium]|nr:4-(cytidine 5'-diphospho)-2-C-methyl-D-erythritol kinase [Betaproteobacteria bacterium]
MRWYPAPAKLNLFLHVVGRRADGYHLLQTAFRLIDRYDQVGIEPRADGELRRTDTLPGVSPEADLCLRAAVLLKEEHALRQGARAAEALGADIGLRKEIPLGGGLGGGSSDAATVLLVLNRLWRLDMTRAQLQALALRLGADVPFFVYGRSALGEGIGERLSELSIRPASYLVLQPQVSVSTKEIFSDAALTRDTKELTIPPFFDGPSDNDLERIALRRYPAIREQLGWLKRHCPDARMTGSGSCVFAEFKLETDALAVQAKLPETMRGFVAQGLDRHPLYEWGIE